MRTLINLAFLVGISLSVTACVADPAAMIERDGTVLSGAMITDSLKGIGFKVANDKVSCEGADDRTSMSFTRRLAVSCSDGRKGVLVMNPVDDEPGALSFDDGTKANFYHRGTARLALANPSAYSGDLTSENTTGASKPENGYLVFSLSRDNSAKPGTDSYQGGVGIYYSNAAHGEENASYCAPDQLIFQSDSKDFDTANGDGTVYVKALPPGTYAFSSMYVSTQCGSDWFFYKGLHLPFEIKPGRTTYMGEFHFLAKLDIHYFFKKSEGIVGLVISDQSARDLEIARKRSKLPLSGVDKFVPETMPRQNQDAPLATTGRGDRSIIPPRSEN